MNGTPLELAVCIPSEEIAVSLRMIFKLSEIQTAKDFLLLVVKVVEPVSVKDD